MYRHKGNNEKKDLREDSDLTQKQVADMLYRTLIRSTKKLRINNFVPLRENSY